MSGAAAKSSSVKTIPALLTLLGTACLSPLIPYSSAAEPEAKPLTKPIGTPKMEGAVSDLAGNFYFCNMQDEGLAINKQGNIGTIPAGSDEAEVFLTLPEGIRGNGLRFGPDWNLYMADQLGGQVVRIDPRTKEVTVIHKFDIENPSWKNSPNDVAITNDGKRLYVSLLGGGLYTMTLEGEEVKKVSNKSTNGVDVAPDGKTLYTANAFYEIQADGTLKETGVKPDLPKEGYTYTDGLRSDAEGNVYISRAGARVEVDGKKEQQPGGVHVVAPDGSLIKTIEAPYSRVHNVGFGGKDGKTLFMICPGRDGFVAVYENEIPGAYLSQLQNWADQAQ